MAASSTERSWCVLECVAVQCAFRRQFGRRGPPETSNRRWYEQFRYRGCICHQVLQNPPIIYTHPVFSWKIVWSSSGLKAFGFYCTSDEHSPDWYSRRAPSSQVLILPFHSKIETEIFVESLCFLSAWNDWLYSKYEPRLLKRTVAMDP
jgi:hypothetical protein